MKKLLGLLAVAPLAIAACGGADRGPGLYGKNVGSSTAMMDQIVSGDVDFAGTWGDARRFNGTGDNSSIVAIGVEQYRIANDGIQAAPNMSAHDMFFAQELFDKVLAEDTNLLVPIGEDDSEGNPEELHVLEVYGHENYTRPVSADTTLSYLKAGVPTTKKMVTTLPADSMADGTIFNAAGEIIGDLDITFIPSTNPTHATTASAKLETWLNATHTSGSGSVTINVATDYDTAASGLENNTVDLAFLPVNTWAEQAPTSQFILQAGRSAQVATLDLDADGKAFQPDLMTNQKLTTEVMNRFSQLYVADVTNAALAESDADDYQVDFKAALDTDTDELHDWAVAVNAYAEIATDAQKIAGSYEAYIWAKEGSEITDLVTANYADATYDNDWTVDVTELELDYGYTSTTSSSTFLFPELWLKRHLDSTLTLN